MTSAIDTFVQQALRLFEQTNSLQQLNFVGRGGDLDKQFPASAFNVYNPVTAPSTVNPGYCASYSGASATSSLRSSPTSSMLSSGPTSPLQQSSGGPIKKAKSSAQSTRQSRAAHNELEKNRRANLRSFLDQIKAILPPEYDSTRDTTLSLLTRARNYLREKRQLRDTKIHERNETASENTKLAARLEELKAQRDALKKELEQVEVQPEPEFEPEPIIDVVMVKEEIVTEPAAPSTAESSRLGSPVFLEYSPSNKPSGIIFPTPADRMLKIDPYLEGLLPPMPLSYPYPLLIQGQFGRSPIA
uniref:BHLH domain-containing protein n=1 Tax=Panagrellus redivivus TaxID=6233 RepID=A0A7E4VKM7_PANRE